ncbi:ABC transporter ATP-binding protein [Paraferrimonas sp. SM1919]|uniref:ABC transporter ATP-binding protein n=1 Tax=Paraferrimonas sp. SM1919 TaxID=2662263 RepID=UPI0013D08590|nr:ABC transporter ATP-binding protein [Paraferrimonas sp. SM1919]
MSSIRCQNLTKTFEQGGVKIKGLDKVNLEIKKGEFLCLSGPSGSGKTTLLNALGGLLTPDSGKLEINGKDIIKLNKDQLANIRLHDIGFIFQSYNLIPVLSAQENVEFIMQAQGVNAVERSQRAQQILKEVGLQGLEKRLSSELSGGQQQRVAVARAIVSKPALILADEPTANLDSASALSLMKLISTLNQKHNITVVLATHDNRIMNIARRQVHMQDGQIVSDLPTENLSDIA